MRSSPGPLQAEGGVGDAGVDALQVVTGRAQPEGGHAVLVGEEQHLAVGEALGAAHGDAVGVEPFSHFAGLALELGGGEAFGVRQQYRLQRVAGGPRHGTQLVEQAAGVAEGDVPGAERGNSIGPLHHTTNSQHSIPTGSWI